MFEEIDTSTVMYNIYNYSKYHIVCHKYIYLYISLKDFIYTFERDIEVSMFTVVKWEWMLTWGISLHFSPSFFMVHLMARAIAASLNAR